MTDYQCSECKHIIGPQWTASMNPREFTCPVTKTVGTHQEVGYASAKLRDDER